VELFEKGYETNLLKAFAEENGLDVQTVEVFMEKRNHPKTLDDIVDMPYDLKSHFSDVVELPSAISQYVKGYLHLSRNEVVESERLIEDWCDSVSFLNKELDVRLWDFTLEDIRNLKPELEKDQEKMDFLKKVGEEIFEVKFGSLKYDW